MAERRKAPGDEHLEETQRLLEDMDALMVRIRARIFKIKHPKPTLVPKTPDEDDTKK